MKSKLKLVCCFFLVMIVEIIYMLNSIASCSMKSLEENTIGRIGYLICWKKLCWNDDALRR